MVLENTTQPSSQKPPVWWFILLYLVAGTMAMLFILLLIKRLPQFFDDYFGLINVMLIFMFAPLISYRNKLHKSIEVSRQNYAGSYELEKVNIMSWGELGFLFLTGPIVGLLVFWINNLFHWIFLGENLIKVIFSIQGIIALKIIFSNNPNITAQLQQFNLQKINIYTLRALVSAATLFGGFMILLLIDIFMLHCRVIGIFSC